MFIPIAVIFVCNGLIIYFIIKIGKKREILLDAQNISRSSCGKRSHLEFPDSKSETMESFSMLSFQKSTTGFESRQSLNVISGTKVRRKSFVRYKMRKKKESNKITRMLLLMSLSYAILNLPYFISWCLFYYHMTFSKNTNSTQKEHIFSAINLCEIIYVLNFGIHFFIYCASGQRFRKQLKDALGFS